MCITKNTKTHIFNIAALKAAMIYCSFFFNIFIYLKKLVINKLHVSQITMTTYSAIDSDITMYITYLH